jgi:hypothetical protein
MKAWGGVIEHYRDFLPVSDRTPVVSSKGASTAPSEPPPGRDCAGGAGARKAE